MMISSNKKLGMFARAASVRGGFGDLGYTQGQKLKSGESCPAGYKESVGPTGDRFCVMMMDPINITGDAGGDEPGTPQWAKGDAKAQAVSAPSDWSLPSFFKSSAPPMLAFDANLDTDKILGIPKFWFIGGGIALGLVAVVAIVKK